MPIGLWRQYRQEQKEGFAAAWLTFREWLNLNDIDIEDYREEEA